MFAFYLAFQFLKNENEKIKTKYIFRNQTQPKTSRTGINNYIKQRNFPI